MSATAWISPSVSLPAEDTPIEWLSPNGGEPFRGFRKGGLWFFASVNGAPMYAYYVPVFWRYVDPAGAST